MEKVRFVGFPVVSPRPPSIVLGLPANSLSSPSISHVLVLAIVTVKGPFSGTFIGGGMSETPLLQ